LTFLLDFLDELIHAVLAGDIKSQLVDVRTRISGLQLVDGLHTVLVVSGGEDQRALGTSLLGLGQDVLQDAVTDTLV